MINIQPFASFDAVKLEYEVIYSNRRTTEISVFPDGRIRVRAPTGIADEDIKALLDKRSHWINRKLRYFHQFEPRTPVRHYVSGETHLYLGRQYRLKVLVGENNSVKLNQGFFWITCKGTSSSEMAKKLMDRWYLNRAREKFGETFNRCLLRFGHLEIERLDIHIRQMKTRWGSLSHTGVLTLNADLIRAPKECIEYVITHELCHWKHRNHNHEFYRLLELIMPDWRQRKQRLETISV